MTALLLCLALLVPHGGRYQPPLEAYEIESPAGGGTSGEGTDGGEGDEDGDGVTEPGEGDGDTPQEPTYGYRLGYLGEPGLGPTAHFDPGAWIWWFAFHEERETDLAARLEADPACTPVDDAVRLGVLLPLFLEAAEHRNRDVRATAALVLGRLGLPAALPTLRELSRDKDLFVRVQAVVSLGVSGRDGALERLLDVADGRRELDEMAVFAHAGLALQGSPEAAARLAHALDPRRLRARDHMVRQGIVFSAGVCADPTLVEPLATLVASRLGRDESSLTALAATSLGRLAVADDRSPTDPQARAAAMQLLLELLGHDATQVRRSAAAALGLAGSALPGGAWDDVAERALHDADWSVRSDLLRCLGRARHDGDHELLLELATDGPAAIRPHAMVGLGLSRDASLAPALLELLELEGVESLRAALAVALGLLEDVSAAPALAAELQEERGPIALAALCLAVGLLGDAAVDAGITAFDDDTRERLLELAERSHDPEVVRQALAALALHGAWDELLELAVELPEVRGTVDRASRVHALGQLRHAALVEPLIALYEDDTQPTYVQRYALAALGALGDPRPLGPAARLSAGADLSHDLELLFELYRLL